MDCCEIRKYSLAGKNKEIKALLLSDQGRNIYHFIFDRREATSRDVAKHFDMSAQHASNVLYKMYKQLYLRRDEVKQDSGGYEWNYYP